MNDSIQLVCIALSCIAIVVSLGTALTIGLLFQSGRLRGREGPPGRHGRHGDTGPRGMLGKPGRDGLQYVKIVSSPIHPGSSLSQDVVHLRTWDGTTVEVLGCLIHPDEKGNEIENPGHVQ